MQVKERVHALKAVGDASQVPLVYIRLGQGDQDQVELVAELDANAFALETRPEKLALDA